MSLSPDRREELMDLLGAVRDERVVEDEVRQLEQLLAEDPEARELYIQYLTLHASLEQLGAADMMDRRLRETLHDEEVVRELRSMIDADRRRAFDLTPDRSRTGRYLVAIVAAAAVVFVALFVGQLILRGRTEAAFSARIVATYGRVESSGVGEETWSAPGTEVRPGRSLRTGPNAYVRLRYPDGSTVDLKAGTELALLKGMRTKRLKLVTGTAFLDTTPQPAGRPLVVNPGRYDQVKVMGTSFEISRDQGGKTRVLVSSGNVLFGADDKAVRVRARQGSVVVRQQQPSQPNTFDQAALWQGLSRGLTATYYDREDLSGKSVTRVDPLVDFDWGKSSPAAAIPRDRFSARWRGQVEAAHTEPYVFYVRADEGARLWIDGNLVTDGWKNARGVKLTSPPIKLTSGQKYELKLEYHEAKDGATIQLLWSSPSTPRAIVPHSYLHPSP